ncbi:MAG TPA: TonB family protein [Candidatus Acidoferrum sp.]|nr:TonB family protein [Candidatus Acidoferrum sp.]
MATGTRVIGWSGTSRRRGPRFPMHAVLDVTVLRSGIPDTVPGRAVNVCERGIAAMLAQELVPGEAVAVEVQLPDATAPLRTRAIVRYQDKLCSGLEFMGLSANQRAAIRRWAKEAEMEIEVSANPAFATAAKSVPASEGTRKTLSSGARPGKKRFRVGGTILLVFVVFAVAVLWWHWNRGWEELESGLKSPEITSSEKPQVQVPAEAMQKLLLHRVEPTYPAEARKANLQGIIALDIVVGRDGSVVNMHALNGPEVLALAAMDALRWWKFEPYRVNGEPAVVETTVAVEFKH